MGEEGGDENLIRLIKGDSRSRRDFIDYSLAVQGVSVIEHVSTVDNFSEKGQPYAKRENQASF